MQFYKANYYTQSVKIEKWSMIELILFKKYYFETCIQIPLFIAINGGSTIDFKEELKKFRLIFEKILHIL